MLVTPHLVRPLDEAPPVLTGEPDSWGQDKALQEFDDDAPYDWKRPWGLEGQAQRAQQQ